MRIESGNKAAGILLTECLAYLALFFLLTGLGLAVFYAGWDHHRNLDRNVDDIIRTLHVGERWRADIRSATSAPELVPDRANQLLRIPRAGGEVLYRFSNQEIARREGGLAWETLLPKVKASALIREERAQVESWRWEIELLSPQKAARVAPLFSFQAVRPTKGRP